MLNYTHYLSKLNAVILTKTLVLKKENMKTTPPKSIKRAYNKYLEDLNKVRKNHAKKQRILKLKAELIKIEKRLSDRKTEPSDIKNMELQKAKIKEIISKLEQSEITGKNTPESDVESITSITSKDLEDLEDLEELDELDELDENSEDLDREKTIEELNVEAKKAIANSEKALEETDKLLESEPKLEPDSTERTKTIVPENLSPNTIITDPFPNIPNKEVKNDSDILFDPKSVLDFDLAIDKEKYINPSLTDIFPNTTEEVDSTSTQQNEQTDTPKNNKEDSTDISPGDSLETVFEEGKKKIIPLDFKPEVSNKETNDSDISDSTLGGFDEEQRTKTEITQNKNKRDDKDIYFNPQDPKKEEVKTKSFDNPVQIGDLTEDTNQQAGTTQEKKATPTPSIDLKMEEHFGFSISKKNRGLSMEDYQKKKNPTEHSDPLDPNDWPDNNDTDWENFDKKSTKTVPNLEETKTKSKKITPNPKDTPKKKRITTPKSKNFADWSVFSNDALNKGLDMLEKDAGLHEKKPEVPYKSSFNEEQNDSGLKKGLHIPESQTDKPEERKTKNHELTTDVLSSKPKGVQIYIENMSILEEKTPSIDSPTQSPVEETNNTDPTKVYDKAAAKKASEKLAREIIEDHKNGEDSQTKITDLFKHNQVISSLKEAQADIKVNISFESDFEDIKNDLLSHENGKEALKDFITDISKGDKITFATEENKNKFLEALKEHDLKIDESKIEVKNEISSKVKKLGNKPINSEQKAKSTNRKRSNKNTRPKLQRRNSANF